MSMKHNISILCIGAMLALGGCYYDIEEELYPGGGSCETLNVTFSGTIKPLVQSRCTTPSCHGGAQAPNLTADAAIKQIADNGSLKARVIDRISPAMPPGGALPPCEVLQLQKWLDEGAPINN